MVRGGGVRMVWPQVRAPGRTAFVNEPAKEQPRNQTGNRGWEPCHGSERWKAVPETQKAGK